MTDRGWAEQVAALGHLLGTVEERVARGDRDAPGLAELKSALDDLRLRAWGLLMTVNAEDPHGFQEGFRILRGTEMCRALAADLRSGKLRGTHPDLPTLSAAARDLSGAVKEVTPKRPRRPRKSG